MSVYVSKVGGFEGPARRCERLVADIDLGRLRGTPVARREQALGDEPIRDRVHRLPDLVRIAVIDAAELGHHVVDAATGRKHRPDDGARPGEAVVVTAGEVDDDGLAVDRFVYDPLRIE